jgi:methionine--tRNA ligase beta chain
MTITIDDFKKVEIKIGKILSAEKVPETDKLLKLSVDFSEALPRQIISGIATFFPNPEAMQGLIGKKATFVTNLEPRMIKGLESQGMLLALGEGETFSLLVPTKDVAVGSLVR